MAITRAPQTAFAIRTNISPMGPSPMTATVSPGCTCDSSSPRRHTGQRLDQSGVLIAQVIRNHIRILLHDARRNADEFGISAVIEQQIFAEILLSPPAEETITAGSGIRRDHALADTEIA